MSSPEETKMSPTEFAVWLNGFLDGVEGPMGEKHKDVIREKLGAVLAPIARKLILGDEDEERKKKELEIEIEKWKQYQSLQAIRMKSFGQAIQQQFAPNSVTTTTGGGVVTTGTSGPTIWYDASGGSTSASACLSAGHNAAKNII